jgi:surfeit locus 1 family protein
MTSVPTRTATRTSRHTWIVLAAAVLGAGLTARLGVWQLDRASQKMALQAKINERTQLPALSPADIARDPQQAEAQHQRVTTVTGRWLPDTTVFLDNRTMDGRTGFFVVTPLRLPSGEAVLVQRGWAPRDPRDRTRLPPVPNEAGDVTLQGRLAPWPSPLMALGEATGGTIRQNLDRDAYAREFKLQLLPATLQLTAAPQAAPSSSSPPSPPSSSADDGLLRHWWVPTADVQKHYGYAAQWFALSALIAGLYVWFQHLRPRLRQRHDE